MNKLLLIIIASTLLSGCMSPIGKEEFTCPNSKKGGVCAGPRQIYELTNDRENLNNLAAEQQAASEVATSVPGSKSKEKSDVNGDVVVYKARDNAQHTQGSYQATERLEPTAANAPARDGFESYPANGEPLAPEPLAVLNPAKVMRALIAGYKDKSGNLNMPGYVYVQVEPEVWSFGEAANLRPTRVVPLDVRSRTQQEERNQQERGKGVSPLEYMTGGENK